MRIFYIFVLLYGILTVNAEIFSIMTAGVAVAGFGALISFKDKARCMLYECCEKPHINPNFERMGLQLRENVYGQHLIQVDVWNAVVAHWRNENPKKPLVLSFHGPTGTGKNHVSRIIVENLFKKGMKSSLVHTIVATNEFTDMSLLDMYKTQLRDKIVDAVTKCERALFIFDEIDKMPAHLLESIKPFLDYYENIRGIDFRKATFIFLSNRGAEDIARIALDHHNSGKVRDDLVLHNFERVVMEKAFKDDGGLRKAEIIKHQLIDHYVPFLPLERRHIALCVEDYLKTRRDYPHSVVQKIINQPDFMASILDSLQYFPVDAPVFSSSGCKRVQAKADLELSKRLPPSVVTGVHNLEEDAV